MTVLRCELPERLREGIYDHVFDAPNREVGGVLVGHPLPDNEGVVVRDFIPALEAEGDLTRLTFTHEAWASIHAKLDDPKYEGAAIVGWYHSHPGHGIFLSEDDVFIHKHFFGDPSNVAYVIDPQQGLQGWFGWIDGEIVAAAQTATDWAGVGSASQQHRPNRSRVKVNRGRENRTRKQKATPALPPPRRAGTEQRLLSGQHYPFSGYLIPLAAGLVVGLLLALLVTGGDSKAPASGEGESFDSSSIDLAPTSLASRRVEIHSAAGRIVLTRGDL